MTRSRIAPRAVSIVVDRIVSSSAPSKDHATQVICSSMPPRVIIDGQITFPIPTAMTKCMERKIQRRCAELLFTALARAFA